MSLLAARKRIVTFRLTDTEFDALRRVCESARFRSISDFSRDAVMYKVRSHNGTRPETGEELRLMNERLEDVADGVRELRTRIAGVLTPQCGAENEAGG